MIDREHDLPIKRQASVLRISRGSVYYLPHSGFVAGWKPENEPQYGFGHCGSFLLPFPAGN